MGRIIPGQKIVLVTGKGGVGKSTLAALVAKSLATKGKRVLLAELSETSSLKRSLDLNVEYTPTEFTKNAWISLFKGESCLKEFVAYYLKIEAIVNLFFDNKVMKALVKAAPALRELAILGKITSGVRGIGPDFDFDYVIVDGYPTGHFQSLLQAPKAIGEIIDVGPMGDQSRGIDRTLKNPEVTFIINVTLAEEMPMTESQEFINDITKMGFPEPLLVVNKWIDAPDVGDSSKKIKENSFIDYISNLSERQKKCEKLFGASIASRVPYDYELNFKQTDLQTLKSVEALCKTFL